MFLPALSKVVVRHAESAAVIRVTQTALAIEKFRNETGILPNSLDELGKEFVSLKDPFDGESIRYRLLSKGYVVYSIGSDGSDDGGREKPHDRKRRDDRRSDITIIVER